LPWTHEDCNFRCVNFTFGEEIVASSVSVEIAPGELIDKITILEIKLERIKDTAKLSNVFTEWETLTKSRDAAFETTEDLAKLTANLKVINEDLWVIEDDIRNCEKAKDFSNMFVQLARAVYVTNDHRADIKRAINELLGSRLIEEKSYADYT
jgi:hypothetical protein